MLMKLNLIRITTILYDYIHSSRVTRPDQPATLCETLDLTRPDLIRTDPTQLAGRPDLRTTLI